MSINMAPYTASYFKRASGGPGWDLDGFRIAEAIHKLFAPKSAVDYGCGTGRVLKALYHDFGCKDIHGFEGSPAAFAFIHPSIRNFVEQKDITGVLTLPKSSYDVVICTEVAEHIHTKDSEALVHNLCTAGSVVIFSAAPPGQSGTGHINCQLWSYWETLFSSQGFSVSQERTKQYKTMLKKSGTKPIYVRNGVILIREDRKAPERVGTA